MYATNLCTILKPFFFQVCDLKKKQTNYIRGLLSDLQKGIVPKSWLRYNVPGVTINPWIIDFSERIRQLQTIVEAAQKGQTALKEMSVWLGKFHF